MVFVRIELPDVIHRQLKAYEGLYGLGHNQFIAFALTDFILRKGVLNMSNEEFLNKVIQQSDFEGKQLEEMVSGSVEE